MAKSIILSRVDLSLAFLQPPRALSRYVSGCRYSGPRKKKVKTEAAKKVEYVNNAFIKVKICFEIEISNYQILEGSS